MRSTDDVLSIRISYRSIVHRSGRDLVCALLQTDESHRLGLLSGGVRDIKVHGFYSSLDWSALSALKLQPPFKPNEHEWDQATTSPADSKRIAAVCAPLARAAVSF